MYNGPVSASTCLSIEETDCNTPGFIKEYEVIWNEATASRLPHCEIIIGSTVSFAFVMSALRPSFATWGDIYKAGEGVHFPLYLMQQFFPVLGLRGDSDVHLTLVLFITSMKRCWSALSGKKKVSSCHWTLKNPPCALSHWPSLSSIHHSTNGDAHREACFYSLLWIPLEVPTHNRAFFKPLTLPL